MIKYAHIKVGVPETDYNRFLYFNMVKFNVGGHVYSFQDWENGILRRNRRAPYVLGLQFAKDDPRLEFMVKRPDCRIHFALNCGAKSCPPIHNFTVEHLEEELSAVALAFCEQSQNVRLDFNARSNDTTRQIQKTPQSRANTVSLAKIFSWYQEDFAKNKKELPMAVHKYLRGANRHLLDHMIDASETGAQRLKVSFQSYDWSHYSHRRKLFEPDSLGTEKTSILNRFRRVIPSLDTPDSPTESADVSNSTDRDFY